MIKLPQYIKNKMVEYKAGGALPKEYINYHYDLALYDLNYRKWDVTKIEGLTSDGWLDGAKFLTIIIEVKTGVFYRLQWHESGAWFRQSPSGAWVREYEEMLDSTKEFVERNCG